jgi:hypothetical protein
LRARLAKRKPRRYAVVCDLCWTVVGYETEDDAFQGSTGSWVVGQQTRKVVGL